MKYFASRSLACWECGVPDPMGLVSKKIVASLLHPMVMTLPPGCEAINEVMS
jgi:hypothetical protein